MSRQGRTKKIFETTEHNSIFHPRPRKVPLSERHSRNREERRRLWGIYMED